MPKPQPEPTKEQTDHAEEKVLLIRSLFACEGFTAYLKPLLETLRNDLASKINDGTCASFEEYKATVALRSQLDSALFTPLNLDLDRHLATLARARTR